jgi:hypothetical protein
VVRFWPTARRELRRLVPVVEAVVVVAEEEDVLAVNMTDTLKLDECMFPNWIRLMIGIPRKPLTRLGDQRLRPGNRPSLLLKPTARRKRRTALKMPRLKPRLLSILLPKKPRKNPKRKTTPKRTSITSQAKCQTPSPSGKHEKPINRNGRARLLS